MNIENSEIMDNLQAGIHHDPKLEKLEQRELAEWMSLIDEGTPNTIVRIPKSEAGTDPKNPLVILEGESKLIISQVGNFSLESFIFTTPSHLISAAIDGAARIFAVILCRCVSNPRQ